MMIRRSPAGKQKPEISYSEDFWSQRMTQGTRSNVTCDDVAHFVRVIVPAEEVGDSHNDQPKDGDEDAHPLTGLQAAAQEGDWEQAGEDDDGPTQHLEAGGAGHVESYQHRATETEPSIHKKLNIPQILNKHLSAFSTLGRSWRTYQHTWWKWPSCRTWQAGKRGADWSFGPDSSWALVFVCHGKVRCGRQQDSSAHPETSPLPAQQHERGGQNGH